MQTLVLFFKLLFSSDLCCFVCLPLVARYLDLLSEFCAVVEVNNRGGTFTPVWMTLTCHSKKIIRDRGTECFD